MSNRNWTDAQKNAINTKYLDNGKSCNVLVGAAAGSGKTAVLVERVIKKLIPENISESIDIDKLLIVTFTNAAAREMEERINKALADELEKAISTGDEARKNIIKRQQLLLSVSDITTIDAFCLKLLRANFNVLGLEPDFSIADASQAQILSDEAMEELFASLYEENDPEFIDLLCLFASSKSDEGLANLVRFIYDFTRSVPHPLSWLFEKVEELKCENGIENTLWFKKGFSQYKENISSALHFSKKGLELICETTDIDRFIANNPPQKGIPVFDEWKSYYNAFYHDYLYITSLLNADFNMASKLSAAFSYERLAKLDSKSDEEKDLLKDLRNKVKESLAEASLFSQLSPSEIEEQSREKLYPVALSLAKLVKKYDELFMSKKLAKNILEFHDAEQLTAQLLSENPDISNQLKDKYHEIMMDEYQDTSLLQEEIFKYVTDGTNLFMVGDMKQSIYRFRSSDPTIFKSKSDIYEDRDGALNRKIILSKNFRSRKEVLESINDIFASIMTESAGELDYDSDQWLYHGNESYQNVNKSYTSECIVLEAQPTDFDADEEEDLTNPALEARFVANEINRLKAEHFKVRDGDIYRDIENRDIVILMSSYKSSSESYIAELNSAGIECFVESSGYFERNEVSLMLSLFKVINNPYCDIPLLAVLRSPIAAFTDDELVIIRKCKKGRFFGALKELISLKNSGEITDEETLLTADKAESFYTNLKRWRSYSRYMSSDRLVWTLYEETDFYAFAGAMHDGEEAQANLRLLFDRAKQYENNGFQGLFNFIKYIERMKKKDTDLSSAKLVGEGHNVVRIMTIHKSKGLEFPVVFITGGGKRFNKTNRESRILLHKDYGIAMDYIDFENSYKCETPAKAIFKSVQTTEQMSEEIRKLYVATTRAKEKLYFVTTVSGNVDKSGKSGLTKAFEKWDAQTLDGKPFFTPSDVKKAGNFSDWVVPVAKYSDTWKLSVLNYSELSTIIKDSEAEDLATEHTIDISHILDFEYPYSQISSLPTKTSVTAIKSDSQETILNPVPEFLKEKKQSGAFYGTAMHKVLENLVPTSEMNEEYVKFCIAELVKKGEMTCEEADLISPEKIVLFYSSSIGKRIINADKVWREQPFEVQMPANHIYPDVENSEDEVIILQGVIDCYFEEDGELVLVDYKTDRYTDISEIHEKYDKQLNLYSYALSKITKKSVKEKFIYLFFDNNVV